MPLKYHNLKYFQQCYSWLMGPTFPNPSLKLINVEKIFKIMAFIDEKVLYINIINLI